VHHDEKSEREFREALLRVGLRSIKNAEWFLALVQEPLEPDGAHSLVREQLWHDLLALGILASRSPDPKCQGAPLSEKERSVWRGASGLGRTIGGPRDRTLEAGSFEYRAWWTGIRRIQEQVSAGLNAALNKRCIDIPLAHVILRLGDPRNSGIVFPLDDLIVGKSVHDVHAGAEGAVLLRLKQLLDKYALLLRQCECDTCEKVFFIARRQDQQYCSSRCRMRIVMRNRRARERASKSRFAPQAKKSRRQHH
jgi:hypothetical protein